MGGGSSQFTFSDRDWLWNDSSFSQLLGSLNGGKRSKNNLAPDFARSVLYLVMGTVKDYSNATSCAYYLHDNLPISHQGCQLDHASCDKCNDYVQMGRRFLSKWQDPLVVLSRDREPTTSLRGMLAGRSVFLLCGGPSANNLPLENLGRRGMWTMAVNNVAGHHRIRPQAFVCSDPPRKFSYSVWMDPGIMKFIPTPKLKRRRGKLRKKVNGEFVDAGVSTMSCPNVWGFNRYSWLSPDDRFFRSDGACWGNHQAGCAITHQPKTVCTMLLALRLLSYLGASTVYLLGVDFRTSTTAGYSFAQSRTADAVASNTAQFVVVNEWLTEMERAGVFSRFGMTLYNCYRNSGLRAFPYVPFDAAMKAVQGDVETCPDLSGWYEPSK